VEVDVEHVEEQQGSFFIVDVVDVHGSHLLKTLA
jgi:hypothetical protein